MSFEKLIIEKLGPHHFEEVTKNRKNKNNILFQIEELLLDEIFTADKLTEDHKNTLEKYTSLIHLTLNSIGLTSLENFPKLENAQIVSKYLKYFTNLIQIELNGNKLKGDDLEILLKNCPDLYKIKLEHNLIENLDNLKCLANYKIKKINLEGNPLTSNNANYRDELFKLVPSLESIDGIDKDGNQVESTLYNEEGEEEDDDANYEEGEEDGDFSDDGEGEEGEDKDDDDEDGEDDDEEEKPQKRTKDY